MPLTPPCRSARPSTASSSGSAAACRRSTPSTPSRRKGDGKKVAGCYYDIIDTAIPDAQVLRASAAAREDGRAPRARAHGESQRHRRARRRDQSHAHRPACRAAASSIRRIGSIIAHQRKAAADGVPALRRSWATRAPRAAPASSGRRPATSISPTPPAAPPGLALPPDISPRARGAPRRACSPRCARSSADAHADDRAPRDYDAAIEEGFRLQGGDFMKAFDLAEEPDPPARGVRRRVRPALPARAPAHPARRALPRSRLQHQLRQRHRLGHAQRRAEGAAPAHPGTRPERRHAHHRSRKRTRLLDKTLIVVAGEFGRPAQLRQRRRARPSRQMLHRASSPAAACAPASASARPTNSR